MMLTKLNTQQIQDTLIYVSQKMVDSKTVLSKADQIIGDGDHGIGMARGFASVLKTLETKEFENPSSVVSEVGMTLLSSIGGAAGAVFGSFFLGIGKSLVGQEFITIENFTTGLSNGMESIMARGKAKVGDKTMLDALNPAIQRAKTFQNEDFAEYLHVLWEAAEEGKEGTKDLIATVGKAKTLGERSLGYIDPGALSLTLIFKFMYEYINNL
ncbi:MAG: dihydroxyacetone kinase subunit L [Anaerolineaceae bacterium]|nr:dihydroxyacetone kinase subunit L [Anaerolineaceae bacterium]